jgi:2-oxo-4-hydroxy-4-carboxy-5-ureidoimidazoline decarboxylase
VSISLAQVNDLSAAEFEALLGGIFEHSPWVAQRARAASPFASLVDLHAAMVTVVEQATEAEKLALLRAHPDLAGKLARTGGLTAASSAEQASVGLDSLNEADYESFSRQNRDYVDKFGFPFIIAVRENTLESIRDAFRQRLKHTRAEEFAAALHQVGRIGWHRLSALITG